MPLGALTMFAVQALLTLVSVRLLGVGLTEGYHPVRSRTGWQVWATERLMDDARSLLFPLYASLVTPVWLRALGARIGRDVEASTVLMLPRMTSVGDGAFLADDTMVGSYELGRGWMRIERARVGKRAFLGNSGMTAPGRVVPKRGLVAVLSATPARAKAGSSWLGSPPVRLRRATSEGDEARTFTPPRRLRVARGAVEVLRLVPVACTVGLGVGVLLALQGCLDRWGVLGAVLLAGPVVLLAAVLACLLTTAVEVAPRGSDRGRRPPVVELLRLAQRAGRHVRRDGGRPVVRPVRGGDTRPVPVAALAGSARGPRVCGARPTGCPRPTWSRSVTARASTGGAWCRRTCSMIGS